jgi:hypothetical protein
VRRDGRKRDGHHLGSVVGEADLGAIPVAPLLPEERYGTSHLYERCCVCATRSRKDLLCFDKVGDTSLLLDIAHLPRSDHGFGQSQQHTNDPSVAGRMHHHLITSPPETSTYVIDASSAIASAGAKPGSS